jgi:hypothetical protein
MNQEGFQSRKPECGEAGRNGRGLPATLPRLHRIRQPDVGRHDRRGMANGAAMIVNPLLDVRLVCEESGVKAVTLRAPVKGESLKVTTIDREHDPKFFGLVLIYIYLATKGARMPDGATEREQERLSAIGFLVPDDQVSSPVYYSCDFNGVLANLLPVRAQQRLPSAWDGDLIVNPTLQHLGKDGITPEMRGRHRLANPFHRDRSWFSIEDGLSVPAFYSYTPDASVGIGLLSPGQPIPKVLSSDVRQKLVEAGVLRLRTARRETRERERVAAHKSLVERRFVILQEIIQPVQLAAIRRYYRELIDEGFLRFGDPEWPNRFFSPRDGLTYFFQQQLTTVISEIAGEKVKPSFSFFASYRRGSDLKAHRDRQQCHYAMSVLLDHDHADDLSSWPIYVRPPGAPEAVPVSISLGDGLLYFGGEVLHYRAPLADGYSTHWFLFWVPESFAGPLD